MSETRPQGFCKDCRTTPAPVKPDGETASRCIECAAKRNAAMKAARAQAKANGYCAWEGGGCTRKPQKGRTYCKVHLAYHRER